MPKVIGDIKLYSLLELSNLLEVTDVTLRRYIKAGKLKAQKIAGSYQITEESLKEFCNGELVIRKKVDKVDNEEYVRKE